MAAAERAALLASRAAASAIRRLDLLLVLLGVLYVLPAFAGGPRVTRAYAWLCAQAPGHALEPGGRPMPLCARCLGLFGGFAVAGALRVALGRPQLGLRAAALLCLPLLVDVLTQSLGLRESDNALRLGTGLLAGAALAFLIVPVASRVARMVPRSHETA